MRLHIADSDSVPVGISQTSERARELSLIGSKRQGTTATDNIIYWRSHISKRKNVSEIHKCYPKYDIRNTDAVSRRFI